jgi:hypothetical protein
MSKSTYMQYIKKFILFLLCIGYLHANAQIIYFNNTSSNIYRFDVSTCTATLVFNGHAFNDMAVGSDTIIYELFAQTYWKTNLVTNTTVQLVTHPVIVNALEFGGNGLLYAMGQNLWTVNPVSGALTLIGPLPAGWNSIGDLVYQNGMYYGAVFVGSASKLALINVTNPAASTIITDLPKNFIGGAAVNNPTCPKQYWFSGTLPPNNLYEYDVNANTWTAICQGFNFFVGGAGSPTNYSFPYTCACTTNAGTVTNNSTNYCLPSAATVPYNNNATLEAGDLLQYVLFTNASSPASSILAQSNTATIPFNPATMQTNVTYYVATVAGNALNGNVDLTDPCLDFSNAAQVTWKPAPTVTLATANPDLCEGSCKTINLNFTGTPPFNLTYSTPLATMTQTFTAGTGILTICAAAGTSIGNFNVTATMLMDANCACP